MSRKLKKHKGSIDQILVTAVCLVFLFVIFACILNFCSLLDVKREISSAVRAGMLEFESGTDAGTVKTGIKNRLSRFTDVEVHVGVANGLDIDATRTPAYGDRIGIEVKVTASARALKLSKVESIFSEEYEFKTKQFSVSKAE